MSFLPGWQPALVGFAAETGLTLSQISTASSSGATITGPSTIAAADLIVLLDRASRSGSTPPSAVLPSGFTAVSNLSVTDDLDADRQIVSYKLATGSEASASLTGMSGDTVRKVLATFRGSVPLTSVNASAPNGQIVELDDPDPQVVTASGGTPPLIAFGCYGVFPGLGSVISPRTFSPAKDGEIGPSNELYLAWRIFNSSPQNVTVDMEEDGFFATLQSFYLEAS